MGGWACAQRAQQARRNELLAQRKQDSDFQQLLPLCDLIRLRFHGKTTNERLDTLVDVSITHARTHVRMHARTQALSLRRYSVLVPTCDSTH